MLLWLLRDFVVELRGADGEARVAASMMVQVDPGFGKLSVPVWLINFVLKVMAPYIYRMLQKLLTSAKHFGRDGVYTSRMDGNRALYAFVRRRSSLVWLRKVGRYGGL